MTRFTLPLLIGALILSGCGRFGDSGWNPLGWRGAGASTPETLAPEGGYPTAQDARPAVPQILGAEWQPLSDGRLLVLSLGRPGPVGAAVRRPAAARPGRRPAPALRGLAPGRGQSRGGPARKSRHGHDHGGAAEQLPAPVAPVRDPGRGRLPRDHPDPLKACANARAALVRSGRRRGRVVKCTGLENRRG